MDITKHLIKEMSDDENPEYMFQGLSTKILLGLASGKLNAKKYAAKELANMGLGKKGEWVGFDKATKIWKV